MIYFFTFLPAPPPCRPPPPTAPSSPLPRPPLDLPKIPISQYRSVRIRKWRNRPNDDGGRSRTTSQRSSRAFLAEKNKLDKKNSYATSCGENVPEEPHRTHRDNLPLISSKSSVATMEIFPSRENSWTNSALKSSYASLHPVEGAVQFSALILAMSTRSATLLDHTADFLRYVSHTQSFWFTLDTSYDHSCATFRNDSA
jgi:hypothetical protein